MKIKKGKVSIIAVIVIAILASFGAIYFALNVKIKNDIASKIKTGEKLAGYTYADYVKLEELGNNVNEIYFRKDLGTIYYDVAGWCLNKGASLWGYDSGRDSKVTGTYNTNTLYNAKDASSAKSLRWLFDNMVRIGTNVTEEENLMYRKNLQDITGVDLSQMKPEDIFKSEQYVIWQFTQNVDGTVAIPENDTLAQSLYNKALNRDGYNSDGSINSSYNKIKIEKGNGCTVTEDGWIGPLIISGNNAKDISLLNIKINDTGVTFNAYKEKDVKSQNITDGGINENLKNNSYNGQFYIKLNQTFEENKNYKIHFDILNTAYSTTATYCTTMTDNLESQPFLIISRDRKQESVPLEFEYYKKNATGSYNLKMLKKSNESTTTSDDTSDCIEGAKFSIQQFLNDNETQGQNPTNILDGENLVETVNGDAKKVYSSDINIDNINVPDTYIIQEVQAPKGYNIGYKDKIKIKVTKEEQNDKYILKYWELYTLDKDNNWELARDSKNISVGTAVNFNNVIIRLTNNTIEVTYKDPKIQPGKYAVKIEKKSAIDNSNLGGAEFSTTATTDYNNRAQTKYFATSVENSFVSVFDKIENKDEATGYSDNNDKVIPVKGTETDNIYIQETKAPEGFDILLKDNKIKLEITKQIKDNSYDIKNINISIVDKDGNYVEEYANYRGNITKTIDNQDGTHNLESESIYENQYFEVMFIGYDKDGMYSPVIGVILKDQPSDNLYNFNIAKYVKDNEVEKPENGFDFDITKSTINIRTKEINQEWQKNLTTSNIDNVDGRICIDSQKIGKDNVNLIDKYYIKETKNSKYMSVPEVTIYVKKEYNTNLRKYIVSGISKDLDGTYGNNIEYAYENSINSYMKISIDEKTKSIEAKPINIPVIPYKFIIKKVDADNNTKFLNNTKFTINKETYTYGEYSNITNETLKNEESLGTNGSFTEENVNNNDTSKIYSYKIYEKEAETGYQNVFGKDTNIQVNVKLKDDGTIDEGETKYDIYSSGNTEEMKKYIKDFNVDQQNHTISITIENPKITHDLNLQLFKHVLNSEDGVDGAKFNVSSTDENWNAIKQLDPIITIKGEKQKIDDIQKSECNKTYYYEIEESDVPENFVKTIKKARLKIGLDENGEAFGNIVQIMKPDTDNWINYNETTDKLNIELGKDGYEFTLKISNTVAYNFNLYKRNYKSNITPKESEKFTGTVTFKVEQTFPIIDNPVIFEGELNDAQAVFSNSIAKTNSTYKYKITETSVSDNYYKTLINIPIYVTIRTDENGKLKEIANSGSEFSIGDNLAQEKIEQLKTLVNLEINNNNANLYVANISTKQYLVQLVKVDKNGMTVEKPATFTVTSSSSRTSAEANSELLVGTITKPDLKTNKGILDVTQNDKSNSGVVDPGYIHTYSIKEQEAPKGYDKISGTVKLTVDFSNISEFNGLTKDNVQCVYLNENNEQVAFDGLNLKFDTSSNIPMIQIYLPNTSIKHEFALIKTDFAGNKLPETILENGNIDAPKFTITRQLLAGTNILDGTPGEEETIFSNDTLIDSELDTYTVSYKNAHYRYTVTENSAKTGYTNILDGDILIIDVYTDDNAKIQSEKTTYIVKNLHLGNELTEKLNYITVKLDKDNYENDKLIVKIKNPTQYKVRIQKTDMKLEPVNGATIVAIRAGTSAISSGKVVLNPSATEAQSEIISDGFDINLDEEQTWEITEQGVINKYKNIFDQKYIEAKVKLTQTDGLQITNWIIKDQKTQQEDVNLKKYINLGITKEEGTYVLNIIIKDPENTIVTLKKSELDGKTPIKGAKLNIVGIDGTEFNGEINNGESECSDKIVIDEDVKTFKITEDSTISKHVNILDGKYLIVKVKKDSTGELQIMDTTMYINNIAIPKTDEVYNFIKVTKTVNEDGIKVLDVQILNPIDFEFELNKTDTSNPTNPLSNTKFEINSPILSEKMKDCNGNSTKIYNLIKSYINGNNIINNIDKSGTITATTGKVGIINFTEHNAEYGKIYEYKIKEISASSVKIVNMFKEYSIYVKVQLNADGTVSLINYDNGKNYTIRKDADGTEADKSYYEYVEVKTDNSGNLARVSIHVTNPTKFNIQINKRLYGTDKLGLSNVEFELNSQINGVQKLTTENGFISTYEGPVKQGDYEYILKEIKANSADIINILDGYYVKFKVHVDSLGTVSLVEQDGKKYTVYNAKDNSIATNIPNELINIEAENTLLYGTVKIKIIDPQKYNIKVFKKDKDTNDYLKNVKFNAKIFDDKDNEIKLKDANTLQDMNLTDLITNQNGEISINNILFENTGTYTIKLHEEPIDGYKEIQDININLTVEIINGKYKVTSVMSKGYNYYLDTNNTKVTDENGISTAIIGINNEKIKGSYNLILKKYDKKLNLLDGAKVKITVLKDGKESELYESNNDEKSNIIKLPIKEETIKDGTLEIDNIRIDKQETYVIKIEEIQAPNKYVSIENPIELKVTTIKEGTDQNQKYVLGNIELNDEQNGLVNQSINNDKNQITVNIKNRQFDLSLRKFITKIISNEGTKDEKSQEITDRIPDPIVTGLVDDSDTTAIYNHTKKPIQVLAGDMVIYNIRIYNEADIDGYAEEITDHLPEYLEFVNDDFNAKNGWILDKNDITLRTVKTTYLSKEKDEKANLINAFDKKGEKLDYKEIQIKCKVKNNAPINTNLTNIAEISKYIGKNGQIVTDRDSSENNVILPSDGELSKYKDNEMEKSYIPGQQDDDDFEKISVENFDLALRKFITGVKTNVGTAEEKMTEVNNRIPIFKVDGNGNYVYNHTKEPVLVANQNVVEYTIRVYNEGTTNGYASLVKDDIPDGLKFLPEDLTNKNYKWKMLDEKGNEISDATNAKYIVTDYLSKQNEKTEGEYLLKSFDKEKYDAGIIKEPDYKEVKVAFLVTMPEISEEIVVNKAQISDDTDENGNQVTDKDSIPDVWNEGEDDQDIEKIKVQYFDLALRKWVTEAIVTEDGKTVTTQTGHKAEDEPEAVVKVDLKKSKIKNVTVKFKYSIRVTNEGEIAGEVKQIRDDIPNGLKFVQEDNPTWKEENGKIVTEELSGTVLQPKESAEVTIVLTWINDANNMGVKINTAEIEKDHNEYGTPDIDSTPGNGVPGEDDIDTAPVMITVKTGSEIITYSIIGIISTIIIATGIILIKKI